MWIVAGQYCYPAFCQTACFCAATAASACICSTELLVHCVVAAAHDFCHLIVCLLLHISLLLHVIAARQHQCCCILASLLQHVAPADWDSCTLVLLSIACDAQQRCHIVLAAYFCLCWTVLQLRRCLNSWLLIAAVHDCVCSILFLYEDASAECCWCCIGTNVYQDTQVKHCSEMLWQHMPCTALLCLQSAHFWVQYHLQLQKSHPSKMPLSCH